MGSLDVFRFQYRHARKVKVLDLDLESIRWTEETNKSDGVNFYAFYLTDFPSEFFVASYNHVFAT